MELFEDFKQFKITKIQFKNFLEFSLESSDSNINKRIKMQENISLYILFD